MSVHAGSVDAIRHNFEKLIEMSGARSLYQRDVSALLENADGVHAFRQWLNLDAARCTDALDLYLAVRGLALLAEQHDPNVQKTACQIHRRFISLRTGSCNFLPNDVRAAMSHRMHALAPSIPNVDVEALFDLVREPLTRHLGYLHTQFTCSKLFHEFLHSIAQSAIKQPHRTQPGTSADDADDKEEGPPIPPHANSTWNTARKRKIKHPVEPGTYRHDRSEDRALFAADLTQRLNAYLERLEHKLSVSRSGTLSRRRVSYSISVDIASSEDEELARLIDESESNTLPTEQSALPTIDFEQRSVFFDDEADVRGRFALTLPRRKAIEVPPSESSSGFCSAESALCDMNSDNSQESSPFNRRDRSRDTHRKFAFSTIPRPNRISKPQQPSLLTVTLKEDMTNAIPLVAKIPCSTHLTLREFRKIFGLSRSSNNRYFFKSPSDDGSAPFQWTLLINDEQEAPIFNGQIIAEMRACCNDDSD